MLLKVMLVFVQQKDCFDHNTRGPVYKLGKRVRNLSRKNVYAMYMCFERIKNYIQSMNKKVQPTRRVITFYSPCVLK